MKYEIAPLADRVVIRPKPPEEVSEGGIIIPEQAQEQTFMGWIVCAGQGVFDKFESSAQLASNDLERSEIEIRTCRPLYKPVHVKVGDFVLFSRYAGVDVTINGEKLVLTKEDGVLAVLRPIEEQETA